MVQLFVGVTDRAWFDQLAANQPLDEVNFWQPSGRNNFKRIEPGELFLFKLHAPDNVIVGGGVFSHATNVPLSLAWNAFGTGNGAPTLADMRARIAKYRRDGALLDPRADPVIGCRILTQPFFWPREMWFDVPPSWAPNIVQGKGFEADDPDGRYIWDGVVERQAFALGAVSESMSQARYGVPQVIAPRLGQGAFRLAVTDSYERRCAVSGEKTLPILDAAHIRPYAEGGDHRPANGVLLRTDIHRLFDLGYVTFDNDHRFVVSRRLKADFDNGRHYYDLHGTRLRSPILPNALPAPDVLDWHRNNRFLG